MNPLIVLRIGYLEGAQAWRGAPLRGSSPITQSGYFGAAAESVQRSGRLADLDQVAVGIADVAADLARMLLRLRQEVGSLGAPLVIELLDVGHPDVEKGAHPVGLGGR